MSEVNHPAFHCSPLLTRPKDGDKRRVIMDLSYPKGNSVNYFVDKDAFNGTQFTLHFPTVDDIADDIIATTQFCLRSTWRVSFVIFEWILLIV